MFKHPFLPPGYEYKKDGSDIDIHKSLPDEDTPACSLVACVSHEYAGPGYERGKLYAIKRSVGSMSHFFVQEDLCFVCICYHSAEAVLLEILRVRYAKCAVANLDIRLDNRF